MRTIGIFVFCFMYCSAVWPQSNFNGYYIYYSKKEYSLQVSPDSLFFTSYNVKSFAVPRVEFEKNIARSPGLWKISFGDTTYIFYLAYYMTQNKLCFI